MTFIELGSIIFAILFAGFLMFFASTKSKRKKSKAKRKKWLWRLQVDSTPNLIYNGKQQRRALGKQMRRHSFVTSTFNPFRDMHFVAEAGDRLDRETAQVCSNARPFIV